MFKLVCYILLFIIAVIGLIFSIFSLIKKREKEYNGANILSFFIPLVGIIIYAVNVTKNDKLAKSCIKTAIYGLIATLCIYISCVSSIKVFHILTDVKVETYEGTRVIESDEEETSVNIENIIKKLEDNEQVNEVSSNLKGKIYTISVKFKYNTEEKYAKEVLQNFFDENDMTDRYDYNITIKIIDEEFEGLYMGNKKGKIIWSN